MHGSSCSAGLNDFSAWVATVRRVDEQRVTRRGSLLQLGGAGIAAALGWKAVDQASGAGPSAVASGQVLCVLAPEQTEGPFFLPGDKVRRNVTEGKAGVLLTLKLTVLDVSTCKPIKGAAVDIWHCDAIGTYAAATNKTFLRGIQKTDAKGVATFKTVYPGWYEGRTVHIHVRVSLGGNVVHTGQLYFPDAVTDKVYSRSPYSSRPGRSTRNPDDSIYRNGGSRSTLKLKKVGSAYTGSITMGVQR
jgi:protocatechuate 3,4-dioxygenase beta subunit